MNRSGDDRLEGVDCTRRLSTRCSQDVLCCESESKSWCCGDSKVGNSNLCLSGRWWTMLRDGVSFVTGTPLWSATLGAILLNNTVLGSDFSFTLFRASAGGAGFRDEFPFPPQPPQRVRFPPRPDPPFSFLSLGT